MLNRRDLLKSAAALPAVAAVASQSPDPAQVKARIRPAICAYSFRKELQAKTMTYADLVRLAAALDVDGLDLTVYWFPDTTDAFLLPLKRLAYRNNIEIYSISVRTEMTRETPELRAKEVEGIRQWVDVASKLGARHIRVFGGRVPKGATEDQAAGWVVEGLKRAAEYAGQKGVVLGLENHGGITEHSSRVLDMIKRVDSPWVGMNLDTGNFRTDVYNQIERCIPQAVAVQVKVEITEDGKRQPSDWDRVLSMFGKARYRGYMALEYESSEPAPTAVPKLIRTLGTLCSKYSG